MRKVRRQIKQHFDEFKEAKISYGVADGDVYNFDETGFRAGCGRQKKVITKGKKARVVLEDPENRDFISSLECVGGGLISDTKHDYLEWKKSS